MPPRAAFRILPVLAAAAFVAARPAPVRADEPAPANVPPSGPATTETSTPSTSLPSASASVPASPPPATPPPPRLRSHDLGLEVGLNNPAGTGLRYLFLLPETIWAVGAAAGASAWGFRWAFLLRRAEDFGAGQFFQASLGFSTGERGFEQDVLTDTGQTARARFDRTPGRTVEVTYGYRIPAGGVAIDAFVGVALNFQGTVLQVEGPNGFVRLDPSERDALLLSAPGGILLGVSASLLQ